MKILAPFRDSSGSHKIEKVNRLNIADASSPFDFLILILFVFSVYLTPIARRHQDIALVTGWSLIIIFILRYLFFMYSRLIFRKSSSLFLWGQFVLTLVWSLNWGLYCAYVLAKLPLGWTTYFLTVSTLAVAAAYVLLHATSRILMFVSLMGILWPTLVVNAMMVPGLRGQATWMLLLAFWSLLIWLGLNHHKKVIEVIHQRSRMAAILEAIPGSICWFNKSMELLGGNSSFFQTFGSGSTQKELALITNERVDSKISNLAKAVMSGDEARVTGSKEVTGRSFYLVGQRYQFGDEALLIGIDISTQESLNQELEQQRKRFYHAGRTAELNQLMQIIAAEERSCVATLKALSGLPNEEDYELLWGRIEILHRALDAIMQDCRFEEKTKVDLKEFGDVLETSFGAFLASHGVTFAIDGLTDATFEANVGGLLLCFSILINNSVDALKKTDNEAKNIRIRAGKEQDRLHIYIEDNGPGIDEVYAEMIFEPYISTNDVASSGLGLAIMNEIVYSYGGTTGISRLSNPTRFFIDLPL